MTLAETQALFHQAITAPGGVEAGRLEACFAGTPDLPAAERVGIYAGMYLWRQVDGLRQTFPCLARLLGDERFAALAEDYLRRHPSEHHDLAQVGRRLADFLREFPDPARPDLGDLAALEWARQEVFFEAAAEPVEAAALAALPPEAVAQVGLVLAPALRLLALAHEVTGPWRSAEDGEPPPPVKAEAAAVAVWRVGFEVVHGALAPDEAEALGRAAAGAPLAEVCAAFEARPDAAAAAFQAVSSWVKEGWIAGLSGARPSVHPAPG
jgi:hypothetical protein